MSKLRRVLDEHESAELLIKTACAEVRAARHRALRHSDGIDYRRRVLARLLDAEPRTVHPGSAQLWKRAHDRLDELGL
ncbi:hypothetical protein [Nocardiopsis synnemataformans]|uniref:hypothetical protein n=1 Tax=Nocardiopsis synnemataformans TaxID=61305 RepID=UPI003EBB295E